MTPDARKKTAAALRLAAKALSTPAEREQREVAATLRAAAALLSDKGRREQSRVSAATQGTKKVVHVKLGSPGVWEPTMDEVDRIVAAFVSAGNDPNVSYVGTGPYVHLETIEVGSDTE